MAKTRKIKFIATAIKWFDKVNGNTYHSVRITRVKDGAVCVAPFQYGYGSQYEVSGLSAMQAAGWLPRKYKGLDGGELYGVYERENNYPISWHVRDGLKRDCVANGKMD